MSEEIVAGLEAPLTVAAVRTLMNKYEPLWRKGVLAAEELRPRIAKGKAWLAENQDHPDKSAGELRLAGLEDELREAEGKIMVGMGFALAEALGEALNAYTEWTPPEGSKLRLILPGILNIGVSLEE